MIKQKHIAFVLIVLFFTSEFYSRVPPSGVAGRGYRFSFGPTLGFYSLKTKHAQNAVAKMSGLVDFKKEINCDASHKIHFLFGGEYFFHGLNFKSYYFTQDTLQLYDKSFAFDYSVFIHEINVPIQLKFSFTRENNSLFSSYIMVGYHFRVMLPANVKVSQNGNVLQQSYEKLKFKIPFLGYYTNSFVSLTAGIQKNTVNHSKAGMFAELSYRYGFNQYSFQTKYSPSSLFINGSHLSLIVGIKF